VCVCVRGCICEIRELSDGEQRAVMAKTSVQGDATDVAPRNFERPRGGGCLRHGGASYHAFWAAHTMLRPATVGLCVDDEQT
jgi:hypothetical protein